MTRYLLTLTIGLCMTTPVFAENAAPYFGNGVKIGEVTANTAIIWTRLTASPDCTGPDFKQPGIAGQVQLNCFERRADEKDIVHTRTGQTQAKDDHTIQFKLDKLKPSTAYGFTLTSFKDDGTIASTLGGQFKTAPAPSQADRVVFTVTTGHKYKTIDAPGKGQKIYPAMGKLMPSFFVHTGDIVYYDNDTPPLGKSVDTARLHWHRMSALPYQVAFHRNVPAYFIKDDHDTLKNDCWAGQTYGELTFAQGLELFREQVPMGQKTYRTVRWGKDLQIWLPEGRDFRSPNRMQDGPEKTIWGKQQIEWFKRTMAASDATFKIVVNATPIVGPDRARGKNDNHANAAFQTEGDWLRKFLVKHNAIVANGDRHWQYHTIDDETGLQEFSCGPSTNKHAGGFSQNRKTDEHRFLRVKGGFLSVTIERIEGKPTATFRHHDVDGNVVNTVKITR